MRILSLVKVYRKHQQDTQYIIAELPKSGQTIIYLSQLEWRMLANELIQEGIKPNYDGDLETERTNTFKLSAI